MNKNMNRLCVMGLKFCKHYEINHNVESNVLTLKVWLSQDTFVTFTCAPNIVENEDDIIVRAYKQSQKSYLPSLRLGMIDKLCGKAARKKAPYNKYAIVSIAKALEIIQNINTYSGKVEKLHFYPTSPEGVI